MPLTLYAPFYLGLTAHETGCFIRTLYGGASDTALRVFWSSSVFCNAKNSFPGILPTCYRLGVCVLLDWTELYKELEALVSPAHEYNNRLTQGFIELLFAVLLQSNKALELDYCPKSVYGLDLHASQKLTTHLDVIDWLICSEFFIVVRESRNGQ